MVIIIINSCQASPSAAVAAAVEADDGGQGDLERDIFKGPLFRAPIIISFHVLSQMLIS